MKYAVLVIAILQATSGCIYEDSEIITPNVTSEVVLESRTSFLLDIFPEYNTNFDAMKHAVRASAGPFNIRNVEIRSAWNSEQHGAEWPASYPVCGGRRQSPINIVDREISVKILPHLKFRNYVNHHPNMSIINNGHTVEIRGPWGSHGNTIPTVSGGLLKGTYQLYGLHFHWGKDKRNGSEHTINSKSGAMEVHFVHFNSKYGTLTNAVAADDPESIMVVGLIFQSSHVTSFQARSLFETLNDAADGRIIYPALFPLDLIEQSGNYFTYEGSLTTPPCTEKVRWIVYEKPLTASEKHYSDNKSYCEDLTEGKFSFPLIHAIRKQPDDNQVFNILKQHTKDIELKKHCVSLLEKFGSFQHTRETLERLDKEAREEVKKLGDNSLLMSLLDDLLDWKEEAKTNKPINQ